MLKREKKPCLVLTFDTTAAAMGAEAACAAAGIPGRLLPVPRQLSSDCGIAWASDTDQRGPLEALIAQGKLEPAGLYELLL